MSDSGGEAPCWAHLFEPDSLPIGEYTWSALVERLAEAVVVSDADGVITFWNSGAERLFGWSAAEATGQTLDLIIPERHRARHWEGFRRVAETGVTRYGTELLAVPALRNDGSTISVAFTLTLLGSPGSSVDRFVAVLRDDTERFREMRALRAENARLRASGEPQ